MSRFISQVASFVTVLMSSDNMRDNLCRTFAEGLLEHGGSVKEYAREFSKQVLATLRRKGEERLLRSATVRISESKRVFEAASNGDKRAQRVLDGKLTIAEYFKEYREQSKGKSKKLTPKSFAARVVTMLLQQLSRQQRSKALALLAKAVRKVER